VKFALPCAPAIHRWKLLSPTGSHGYIIKITNKKADPDLLTLAATPRHCRPVPQRFLGRFTLSLQLCGTSAAGYPAMWPGRCAISAVFTRRFSSSDFFGRPVWWCASTQQWYAKQ